MQQKKQICETVCNSSSSIYRTMYLQCVNWQSDTNLGKKTENPLFLGGPYEVSDRVVVGNNRTLYLVFSGSRSGSKVPRFLCDLQCTFQMLVKEFTPENHTFRVTSEDASNRMCECSTFDKQQVQTHIKKNGKRHHPDSLVFTWSAFPENKTGSWAQNLNRSHKSSSIAHQYQIAEGPPTR